MGKSMLNESHIVAVLKEGEAGMAVAEQCRRHGISAATYYAWKSKCADATVSDLAWMRELEAENAKLKRMYADLALRPPRRRTSSRESGDAVCERQAVLVMTDEHGVSIKRTCRAAGHGKDRPWLASLDRAQDSSD